MQLLTNDAKSADVRIAIDDLLTIHQSLNEVCHGIDVFEFQTRVGVSKEEVLLLMKSIREIINNVEENSSKLDNY